MKLLQDLVFSSNIFPSYTLTNEFVWDGAVTPGSEAVVKVGHIDGRRVVLKVPHPLPIAPARRMGMDRVRHNLMTTNDNLAHALLPSATNATSLFYGRSSIQD